MPIIISKRTEFICGSSQYYNEYIFNCFIKTRTRCIYGELPIQYYNFDFEMHFIVYNTCVYI